MRVTSCRWLICVRNCREGFKAGKVQGPQRQRATRKLYVSMLEPQAHRGNKLSTNSRRVQPWVVGKVRLNSENLA